MNANSLKNLTYRIPKGSIPWNKGLKGYRSGERPEMRGIYVGNKHHSWKGDNVSYAGLHIWVKKELGKPTKCKECKVTDGEKVIHWANKEHTYRRNLTDWIPLCAKCHAKHDIKNNNKYKDLKWKL